MEKMPRYWPFVRGIHRSPVDSLHKGQWHAALIFSLICSWTNGYANNRDVGDLRLHLVYHDVTVMILKDMANCYQNTAKHNNARLHDLGEVQHVSTERSIGSRNNQEPNQKDVQRKYGKYTIIYKPKSINLRHINVSISYIWIYNSSQNSR